MKKSILRSVITAAITLSLSLILTSCGGGSGSSSGGGSPEPDTTQAENVPSDDSAANLEGNWVNEEGYVLSLDGSIASYTIKTPSGRVGSSTYYTDHYPYRYIYYDGTMFDLVPQEDGTVRLEAEDVEEGHENLAGMIFTKDDSATIDFDLSELRGDWLADDATLTLDTDGMEYRLTAIAKAAEGTINNDEDGRGFYLDNSYFDSTTDTFKEAPAFLVLDTDGNLHLEGYDDELAQLTFARAGSETNLAAERDQHSQSFTLTFGGWIDDAGNKLEFNDDIEEYVLETARGRSGRGRLSYNTERGQYEIFLNGGVYALVLEMDENMDDFMTLTLVEGEPAREDLSLDGDRFKCDMFVNAYDVQVSFMHGTWTDNAGFTLNIDSVFEEYNPPFDYVSPEGSGNGILRNDNDGMGWYMPWSGDSCGKAYLIHSGYGDHEHMMFDTDDPFLAAMTLDPKGD